MDFTQLPIELFISQGVFAILFIWLFFDSRKEAKEREGKLMLQIKDQSEMQGRIVQSLERLETQITSIQGGNK